MESWWGAVAFTLGTISVALGVAYEAAGAWGYVLLAGLAAMAFAVRDWA